MIREVVLLIVLCLRHIHRFQPQATCAWRCRFKPWKVTNARFDKERCGGSIWQPDILKHIKPRFDENQCWISIYSTHGRLHGRPQTSFLEGMSVENHRISPWLDRLIPHLRSLNTAGVEILRVLLFIFHKRVLRTSYPWKIIKYHLDWNGRFHVCALRIQQTWKFCRFIPP